MTVDGDKHTNETNVVFLMIREFPYQKSPKNINVYEQFERFFFVSFFLFYCFALVW